MALAETNAYECARLLTLSPDNEPLWVRLYVHRIDDVWAAMLVADDVPPPEPGTLMGLGFFGERRRRPR